MKVADIRSDEFVKRLLVAHKKFVREMATRKDDFCHIPCPACESRMYVFMFEKDASRFVKCTKCGTIFINPQPPLDVIRDFYQNSEESKLWDKHFVDSERQRREQIFLPRAMEILKLWQRIGFGRGKLVDIGASNGVFCEEIRNICPFDEIIAVEPSAERAKFCRQKGIKVVEGFVEDADLSEVDVITAFEVIEHVRFPADFLRQCHKALNERGVLVLTTPNANGFELMTQGAVSNNFCSPGHLTVFNIDSIHMLLERCGFSVYDISTPGKLDAEIVRSKVLNGELNMRDSPFLRYILTEKWEEVGEEFQDFLVKNSLSSHMRVVAIKR